jgi:hypothetical protein
MWKRRVAGYMEWIFILVVIVILAGIFSRTSKTAGGRDGRGRMRRPGPLHPTAPAFDESKLPEGLGLLPESGLEAAAERLQAALPADFEDKLRSRVLAKHSDISQAEFACYWLELKRYFLMTLLLKNTPMFSEKVDDIWHEMLMFTREYAHFCETFAGSAIHHAPHGDSVPMPHERAWFDWVYAHLFEFTPYTAFIWNGFFLYPLDKTRLGLLLEESEERLAAEWFRFDTSERFPEVGVAIRRLVADAKREARQSSEAANYKDTPWYGSSAAGTTMLGLAGTMMFFSMLDDGYAEQMYTVMPEEMDPRKKYDSSSCTAGTACGSSGCTSDGGSNSSGCSSSSCSSGSGCGGGGGD